MPFPRASKALTRFTVLDLTRVRAGPTCARQLADWGANVIKVEAPADGEEPMGGPREGSDFQNLHRNKRSITLDLKTPAGLAAFKRLAKKADVLIENFRPNVKKRLGIDYKTLSRINPRLVFASISGFGQDGPYADRPGFDQIAQGMGGLMSITGLPGQGPVRVGIPIDDLTAGNLLALGIMMAIFDRERTGVGRWVTTSLLEAQIFMLDFQASRWLIAKEVAPQAGNDHPTGIPTGVFPTSDGHINIAASSSRVFGRFCEAIGQPDWKDKPEWKDQQSRSKHRKEINAAIGEITRTKPSEYWIDLLEGAGVPCGPIYSIDQVFADPQVQHLQMATPMHSPVVGDVEVVASGISMTGFSKAIRKATPEQGECTEEVLGSVGYGADEIADMRKKGAI
jgi:crotonobetainyl-CoA:carnitine CoA-transferase CaiB-like acyl-CoA transferase